MSDLVAWVAAQRQISPDAVVLAPVSGDAGFRRYFRLRQGDESLIVMDASADRASCEPFVRIAALLAGGGVRVPRILRADLALGYLMLEDLGQRTLLEQLDDVSAESHYGGAIELLVQLQCIAPPADLPRYDEALLRRELALFPDWYLQRHRGIELSAGQRRRLDAVFELLVARALAQPQVLVHRDFMPRNLMPSVAGLGLIDFQDAVVGPVSYDPLCLFKDAFISWPSQRVEGWLQRYWLQAVAAGVSLPESFDEFRADCDFIGVHRHLKVIGIFARLCHRDGKSRYLEDVPRFFDYLAEACDRQAGLAPLAQLLVELDGQ